MKKASMIAASILVLILQGCGDSSFSGGSGRAGGSADAKERGKSDTASADEKIDQDSKTSGAEDSDQTITALDLADDADGEVIGKCLAEWGKHPFKKQDLVQHRTVEVAAQMLGRSELKDLETTEEPEIIVVKVASSTLGAASLQLLNPKGWYCLDMSAQSLGSTDVTLHCDARIGNQKTSSGGLGRASMTKACD